MLEIIKQFDAQGRVLGTYGLGRFGSMTHISFMLETNMGGINGIPVVDEATEYIGPALVRITMPSTCETSPLIRELKLGDLVQVKGFVCIDTIRTLTGKQYVYYGVSISRSG